MRANLAELSADAFSVREGAVHGIPAVLVEPKSIFSAQWTRHNLMFRSSIWTPDGELISAGLKKFFNAGENPALFPSLSNLKGAEVMEKLDGSCLITSHYQGRRIVRTRGTFDAHGLSNGGEIPALITQYQDYFDYCGARPELSFIAEWYTPSNKIVINYGDAPRLWLTAAVRHADYTLLAQDELDAIAREVGIARPRRFSFDSIEDMRAALELLEGEEGYCVYSDAGQRIDKVKSPRYLLLHKMKSDLSNVDKLVDLWLDIGEPGYNEFYDYIARNYDWELAVYCRAEMSKICDAAKTVRDIEAGMSAFVARIAGQPRKRQAEQIFSSYGKGNNRAGMVFNILDGKGLSKDAKKKLIMQCL